MLGICGGLQFVVRALGKKIIVNPKGKEQGTLPLELTKGGGEDLLFRGLPKKFPVQLTHKVMASELKDEWKILASSKLCRVQALAIGDKIRLTQFHPEMGANELRLITKMRKDKLISAGIFKNNKEFNLFLSSIVDTKKMSRQILKNFLNYFVLPYKTKKL